MVSTDLQASVSALSEGERIELIAYIEHTLDLDGVPTDEQQVLVERRVAEMKADPAVGMTLQDAIAAARALTA